MSKSLRRLWQLRKDGKRACSIEPTGYLSSLPLELIQEILDCLVTDRFPKDSFRDVYCLAATCRRFRDIFNNNVLYETVFVKTKKQASRLGKCLARYPANAALIKTFYYVHPEDDTSETVLLGHSGYSFSSLSNDSRQRPCPDIILDCLAMMVNLETCYLDEIASGFRFPASLRNSKVVESIHQRQQQLEVHLSPEAGWQLTLHRDMLWAFGQIQTLHLTNYVFDHNSFSAQQLNVPNLIISACKIRLSEADFAEAMKQVRCMTIDNLRSVQDIEQVYGLTNLDQLTLSFIGKASKNHTNPPKRILHPAAAWLPVSKRNVYTIPAEKQYSKQMDLTQLPEVLRRLGRMRLNSLTLGLPNCCLLPKSSPHYTESFSIAEQIHHVNHLPVTLLVSSHPSVIVPDVTIKYK